MRSILTFASHITFVAITILSGCTGGQNIKNENKIALCRLVQNPVSKDIDSLIQSNKVPAAIALMQTQGDKISSPDEINYIIYKCNKAVFYHNYFNPCDSLDYINQSLSSSGNQVLYNIFTSLNDYYFNNSLFLDYPIFAESYSSWSLLEDTDPVLFAEILGECGRYYMNEGVQNDSADYYFTKASDIYHTHSLVSLSYFFWIRSLIYLQLPLRNMKKALLYCHYLKTQNEFYHYDNGHLLQTDYLLGMCHYKSGNFDEGKSYFNSGFERVKELNCSFHQQEIYKVYCSTMLYDSPEQISLISIIDSLQIIVNTYGDFCNFNKILSEYIIEKEPGLITKTPELTRKAFYYIVESKPYNALQLYTVTYLNYLANLKTENYNEALDILYSQFASKIPVKILRFNVDSIYNQRLLNKQFYYVTLENYASVFLKKYKKTRDKKLLLSAFNIIQNAELETIRALKTIDDDVIITIFYTARDVYNTGMKISFEMFEVTQNPEYISWYFYFLEKNKSRILHRDLQLLEAEDQKTKEYFQQEKFIKTRIAHFSQFDASNDSLMIYTGRLDSIYRHISTLSNQYFDKFSQEKLLDIICIFDSITENEIYFDFNFIADELYILRIDYRGYQLTRKYPDSVFYRAVSDLIKNQSGENVLSFENYETLALLIYKTLFSENEKDKKIIYSVNALLTGLNPEGLVYMEKQNKSGFGDLHYAIQIHQFERVESLYLKAIQKNNNAPFNSIAAFFHTDQHTLRKPGEKLKELPGTLMEKEFIENYFNNIIIYQGSECTKSNFLKYCKNPGSDIIHLSVHGSGSAVNRNDLFLLFRNSYGQDTLYGYELISLEKMPALIILTACESGKGIYESGEGTYSIARYFMKAGAEKVISSLWNLDDLACALLVKEFYKQLSISYDPGLSLHQAKITIIKKYPGLSHPNYWAALIG